MRSSDDGAQPAARERNTSKKTCVGNFVASRPLRRPPGGPVRTALTGGRRRASPLGKRREGFRRGKDPVRGRGREDPPDSRWPPFSYEQSARWPFRTLCWNPGPAETARLQEVDAVRPPSLKSNAFCSLRENLSGRVGVAAPFARKPAKYRRPGLEQT